MKRTVYRVLLCLTLFVSTLLPVISCGRDAATLPSDIILVSFDTAGVSHFDTFGYERKTSPNLTELARDSVLYPLSYCTATNTIPSHASIFTGLLPFNHLARFNIHRLDLEFETMAEILGRAGYETGAAVSGYPMRRTSGLNQGFDWYDDQFEGRDRLGGQSLARALTWMEKNRGKRRFLFLHLYDCHGPYDPPPPYDTAFPQERDRIVRLTVEMIPKYQRLLNKRNETVLNSEAYRSLYDGAVKYVDDLLGQLLDRLKQDGTYQSSLIIVTADHGETLFERPHILDHGGMVHEEQIRVPLVIKYPENRWAGGRVKEPVSSIDLLPTLQELMGLRASAPTDGYSILPNRFDSTNSEMNDRFFYSEARSLPLRVKHRELPSLRAWAHIQATVRPPWKVITYPARNEYIHELYHLGRDPGEKTDTSGENPGLVQDHAKRLYSWIEPTVSKQKGVGKIPKEDIEPLRALGYIR